MRRLRWVVVAALCLVFDCDEPAERGLADEALPSDVLASADVEAPPDPAPEGTLPSRARPMFTPPDPAPLPWLDAFHRQVVDRAPGLARCFVGTDAPGDLRWTATVNPSTGQVSAHALEPAVPEEPCLLAVLSPPFQLDAAGPTTRVTTGLTY